ESRDPFLRVTGSQLNTRTWTTVGLGFRRYRIHTSLARDVSAKHAHTPLAREAGRGRGPLRSNARVRGVPVTSFFAPPRTQTAAIFTSRSALSDRVPLTLPTLTRWPLPLPAVAGRGV